MGFNRESFIGLPLPGVCSVRDNVGLVYLESVYSYYVYFILFLSDWKLHSIIALVVSPYTSYGGFFLLQKYICVIEGCIFFYAFCAEFLQLINHLIQTGIIYSHDLWITEIFRAVLHTVLWYVFLVFFL